VAPLSVTVQPEKVEAGVAVMSENVPPGESERFTS
jgi:hypothetical protein